MHRLSFGFVLGYHGCDRAVGEGLLAGASFRMSRNDYDWLGEGIYFWEADPARGLAFGHEAMRRRGSRITEPFVVGAVIDLGICLDVTTAQGVAMMRLGHRALAAMSRSAGVPLPMNSDDALRRPLDRAVVQQVHDIRDIMSDPPFDSVRGVFTEGPPAYPGAAFPEKTHIQLAIRNTACIKGVFRVPDVHLRVP